MFEAARRFWDWSLQPVWWFRQGIWRSLSTLEILLGGIGLVAALVAASLLSAVLDNLPGAAGDFAPIGVAILLAPIGVGVALGRRAEVERFVNTVRGRADEVAESVALVRPSAPSEVILDTSAIIDGRIAEVAASGFLLAEIVVPRFVLDELRRVADSSDPLKRGRGRAGLELLARMQSDERVTTEIVDDESETLDADVDARLVRMAKEREAALALTDSNLARVAELEGVRTLNLNVLANAVKTNVLPGEPLRVELIEAGRNADQGVGYLPDGTMVVVEQGVSAIGETRDLVVKRVIQTQAGRMVFAQLSGDEDVQ
ncbi:MAG: PIN domain nuclease [Chloroflexota bacterium]|nr:PIN domain nuclease [Chloroflexota bacterium]MDE2895431.1 PIN domain nuclease [Chloroflexota bacterium]